LILLEKWKISSFLLIFVRAIHIDLAMIAWYTFGFERIAQKDAIFIWLHGGMKIKKEALITQWH